MAGDKDKAIELEGVVTALNVLRVLTPELPLVERELAQRVAQTPALFRGAPIVIDVTALDGEDTGEGLPPLQPFPLAPLLQALRAQGLLPVGVRTSRPERQQDAAAVGLGLIETGSVGSLRGLPRKPRPKPAASQAAPAAPRSAESIAQPAAAPEGGTALTLTQPLRAGRIVYAEGRDAIALAAVNAGAELIADGNIHVYGPLRGRALAGARGNEQARIYCQKLEADLVSVAGVYLSADDLPKHRVGTAVQIYLENDELVITDLIAK